MTRHLRITSLVCLSLLLVSMTGVEAKGDKKPPKGNPP
jgi:hypothetical protein